MKLNAYARHTMPGGEFNYEACREFERLLRSEWNAVLGCFENTINAIEVTINNSAVADLTLRAIRDRLQAAIDNAHKRAEEWDWLRFTVEEC